ncbi:hypothetical protein VN97_g4904 [Penicillium thymicola]|uniref:Uncharacterized protein n=1 Tax=Penicillium thymicola TaxID=293382 RepID=A0AAI9TJE9_PENTH|nr:hypothetical protein VN97_g4904 [Penicillium thymicola]
MTDQALSRKFVQVTNIESSDAKRKRAKGATGDFIHRTTRKEGELFYPAATGKELLKYLGWGSLSNSIQIQFRFKQSPPKLILVDS